MRSVLVVLFTQSIFQILVIYLKIPLWKGFPEAIEFNFLTEAGLLPVLEDHHLLQSSVMEDHHKASIKALNTSEDRALYLCLISP